MQDAVTVSILPKTGEILFEGEELSGSVEVHGLTLSVFFGAGRFAVVSQETGRLLAYCCTTRELDELAVIVAERVITTILSKGAA